MNPILIKPEADSRAQVILMGRAWETLDARDYYPRKNELWQHVTESLDYLRETGFDVREEDLERLSPLVSHHINFVGKYHFFLPEEVERGELRPFHNPDDPATII